MVHVRDAWPQTLKVLEEGSASRVAIHCFSGDTEIANECAARGYWMSFAGNVTYPNAYDIRSAAREVPDNLLLAETDSPYLSPQPRRGRPNEPAYLVHTVAALAEVRGVEVEELAAQLDRNADAAFGLA